MIALHTHPCLLSMRMTGDANMISSSQAERNMHSFEHTVPSTASTTSSTSVSHYHHLHSALNCCAYHGLALRSAQVLNHYVLDCRCYERLVSRWTDVLFPLRCLLKIRQWCAAALVVCDPTVVSAKLLFAYESTPLIHSCYAVCLL